MPPNKNKGLHSPQPLALLFDKDLPFLIFGITDEFQALQTFDLGNAKTGSFYSLPAREKAGLGPISRLPLSLRILLESVLRNCDGHKITPNDVARLALWNAKAPAPVEVPFVVARSFERIHRSFTPDPNPSPPSTRFRKPPTNSNKPHRKAPQPPVPG